jgi:hypothetical protein
MKFAWCNDLPDHAGCNWARVEEVQLGEYIDILEADETSAEWDMQLVEDDIEFILEYAD